MLGSEGVSVAAATRQEFFEAVHHVGTKPGLALSEEVQRRLFGLHSRATRGVPPAKVLVGEHEEHWKAWCEAGALSEAAAMQEYVDLVVRHDPDFYNRDESDTEMPASALPATIVEQLAAANIRAAGSRAAQSSNLEDAMARADVFEAARAGKGLAPFLPHDRDAVDADGLTPLIHAVDAEQAEAVVELLLASASLNLADPQGATALHYAALLGADALVEQLLAGGADPRLVDEDGASPADAAGGEGHTSLADKLAEASARFDG